MSEIQLIATAMGLSALAGINLYLTVFALSLSLNMGWIHLAPGMESLHVMAHPSILIASGIMSAVEFIADKWPWFDSLWDAVHTVIRPAGGIILGLSTLGPMDPKITILAGLFCGGITLTSHLTKTGTRLLVNTSPEPFSNSAVSMAEDLIVVGGLSLVYLHPFVALSLLLTGLILFIWLAPRLARHVFHTGRFILLKLRSIGAEEKRISSLPLLISHAARHGLEQGLTTGESLLWSVPIVTRKVKGLPRNRRGYLCRVRPSGRLAITVPGFRPAFLPIEDMEVGSDICMIYDELTLFYSGKKRGDSVRFAKNHRAYLEKICEELGTP